MKPERYAPIVLMLLKEPLYHGEKWWDELVNSYETEVRTYLAKIGLDLVLDKADGYAFLQQPEIEDGDDKLPRLMRRMKLNREQALLCVVLRQLLLDFDAGEATVLRLSGSCESFWKAFLRNALGSSNSTKIYAQPLKKS
jgi:hypothetical protein